MAVIPSPSQIMEIRVATRERLTLEALDRIEQKLDTLIAALAEEEGEGSTPAQTLDGQPMGGERDQSQPL